VTVGFAPQAWCRMDDRANNSGKGQRRGRRARVAGFTLLEVLTAMAILGLVSSSVLLVINRCMTAAADSALRMEAFTLAQENLEKILVANSVSENVEFGVSELYPDISWQTAVEAFSEPVTGKMWVRAVCSAEYVDSAGEKQTVKLEHWLTDLTEQQAGQLGQGEDVEQLAAEQLLETIEDAAQYAGVQSSVIEEWVEKGLLTTEDGSFIKYNLDLFMQSKGDPTAEDKRKQVKSIQELATSLRAEQEKQNEASGQPEGTGVKDGTTGQPPKQPGTMNLGDALNRLKERRR